MSDHESTLSVQVAAANPLLGAALEHAVTAAGLRVAPSGGEPVVLLRTPDRPATGAPLDISVDDKQITIAVIQAPSSDVWAATLILLRHLLDEY